MDDKPNLEEFLHDAVETMYGNGQNQEVYDKLKGASADEILSYFDGEGYTDDEFVDAMNDYYTDEEEEDLGESSGLPDQEVEDIDPAELASTTSKDTDDDGEIDRTEVDVDGDGKVDAVHIEADSPKELKKALNMPGAETPEEKDIYKEIFKKNAKDTNRKFEPKTPEEKEMVDMFKPSSGMIDALKSSF